MKKNIIFLALLIILPFRVFSDTEIDSLLYNLNSLHGKIKLKRILDIEEYYAYNSDSLAIKYYREALNLSAQLSDNNSYFKAKEILAEYYFFKSNYDKVINLLVEVTNYQQSIKKPDINTYTMLAFSYFKKKQYGKVLEYYTKAKNIVSEKNKYTQGMLENLMGLTYYKLDFNKKAKKRFFKAIKIYKLTDNKEILSVTYNNLALVFSVEKQYEKAIEYTKKSLALDKEDNNKYGIAISELNLGSYYISEKKYSQAKKYLFDSEKLLIKLNEKIKLANVYRNFGEIYFNEKKYLEAEKYLQKSIKLLKNNKYEDAKIPSYQILAKVENHLHNYMKADSAFTTAIKLIDEEAERSLRNNIFKTKAKISFINKNKEIRRSKEIIRLNNIKIKKKQDIIFFISLLLILGIIFYFLSKRRLRIIKNLSSELVIKNNQLENTLKLNKKFLDEKISLEKNNTFLAMGITMNHEITQPLMVIQGNIDMMKMNPKFNENQELVSSFNEIEKAILQMKDILDQMKEIEDM